MADYNFISGLDFAKQMDNDDPLYKFRDQFFIPEEDTIYLDGNSLGRLPVATQKRLHEVTDHEWGTRLIRSWNEGWYERAQVVSAKLEKIIGADQGEAIICDSTSLNLYKLAYAGLQARPGRKKVISDTLNFPTDLYILQGIIDQMGSEYHLELVQSDDGMTITQEALDNSIDHNTALVVLSHVAFKSAFMHDMKSITEMVHRKGALILWDLSHAAGAVPLELSKNDVDLAVGCTYKYLNGGPGAPAFLYVKKNLQQSLKSPVWGWFGEQDPFAFKLQYTPSKGISRFLVGTPPILSLEAIDPGLDIILEAGIDRIRDKSQRIAEYLIFLYNTILRDKGFHIGSPIDPDIRGSHVSLRHDEAYRICKALINPADHSIKVIPDFREPDNIRIGITPLYTTYVDIFKAAERLNNIVGSGEYKGFSIDRDAVT